MTKQRYSQVFIDNRWGATASKHFNARRKKLAQSAGGPVLLWGVPHSVGHPYSWAVVNAPVFQDPFFLYLTGITQPGVILGIRQLPDGTVEDALFLPKKDSKAEFWEGPRYGFEARGSHTELKKQTGFTHILPITQLRQWAAESAQSQKIHTFWTKSKPLHIQKLTRWGNQDGYEVTSLGALRYSAALEFDPQDLSNLRDAHAKTARIFDALVQALPQAQSEQDMHAVMLKEIAAATPKGPSFAPIIASGANAAILHYTKNDDLWDRDELLLLDFGIRDPLIVTDVTRTVPISGKFNPLQKLLYDIVLETQLGVQSQVKAGVSIHLLNDWCWTNIGNLLDERFYRHGGKAKMAYSANKPHFVSHLIGYAVHDGDPTRKYRHRPLEAGMIISNEPGIYGEFEITLGGQRYHETIGIRIEDDLLVGKTGCEVLSAAIPKTVAEIEKAIGLAYR